MQLWQGIAAQRDRQEERRRRWRRRQGAATALLLLAAVAAWWAVPEPAPVLRSFPIPLYGKAPAVRSAEAPAVRPLAFLPAAPAALRRENATAALPVTIAAAPGIPTAAAGAATADAPAAGLRRAPRPAIHALPLSVLPVIPRDPQCVRFGNQQQWKIYADLHGGPAYAFRRLEARDAGYDDYARVRETTEQSRLSYGAGLRLSVVSDFGLALRTGLQYNQFNEQFNYSENREERITITNVYGPNGDFIRTDTIVEKSVHHLRSNNRYRTLDVPLLLGYELRRNKWTIAFNGGALINVLFSARGQFLAPDDRRPVSFSSQPRDDSYQAYKTNIGLGWYASIGLHYQLRSDLQLLVEPHLRFTSQSITRHDYPLEQRYLSSGLSIGLRKQI